MTNLSSSPCSSSDWREPMQRGQATNTDSVSHDVDRPTAPRTGGAVMDGTLDRGTNGVAFRPHGRLPRGLLFYEQPTAVDAVASHARNAGRAVRNERSVGTVESRSRRQTLADIIDDVLEIVGKD